jgi:hypothetical protein
LAARHQYRRLALLGTALLAAGVLVAVPLVVRAARSGSPTCLGPSSAGAVSVGSGIGSGVIALTTVPGAGVQVPVSVQVDNGPAAVAGLQTLWLISSAAGPIPLTRTGSPCWSGSVPRAVLGDVRVAVGATSASPELARFALPDPARSGALLIGRARAATRRLVALRELTLGRRSVAARPTLVDTFYVGTTVVSRSAGGVDRFAWPGWRDGFEWMTPGIQASVILGEIRIGARRAVRVAGAVAQTPLWMEIDIDAASGVVLADHMNGPNHVMASRYSPSGG